jgi:urease accessory protein UreF
MSTVLEIESALKELPLHEAQKLAQWLQRYLDQQTAANDTRAIPTELRLPDYAARRRMILGDKVLPNMVILGRERERW